MTEKYLNDVKSVYLGTLSVGQFFRLIMENESCLYLRTTESDNGLLCCVQLLPSKESGQIVGLAAQAAVEMVSTEDAVNALLQSNSKFLTTVETLFDDESTREKYQVMEKIEVMADDERNGDLDFWRKLDNFIEFGKSYRITISESTVV